MRPFWKKPPPNARHTDPDSDLLAQQEEEAFVASVLKKKQEREASPMPVRRPVEEEAEEIEWSEQEDVYRPRPIQAHAFLAGFDAARVPPLRRGASCCLVRKSAYTRIQAHLGSDTRIELGGLLVGEAFYDAELDLYCLVVEEALPAHEGAGTAITFSYTEATWRTLSPQLQSLPAGWTLLGSYHSHPGMGVFLSSTDLETQRDVFFHDWQIALVIDPISHAVGFFLGAEGHPCNNWCIV